MDLFVDTADVNEITQAFDTGVVDGVTTNPSLIRAAQEKHGIDDMEEYIHEILSEADDKPVSVEVTETSYSGMKEEAEHLVSLFGGYSNMLVKIPVNPSKKHNDDESFDGLRLINELSDNGVRINATVVMSPEQAVLAAKAGAEFVSPFAGRIDDYIREHQVGIKRGEDFDKHDYFPADGWIDDGDRLHDNGVVSGVDLIRKTVSIFDRYEFDSDVLAASARNKRQVREFMLAGADIATLPFSVLQSLTAHYKTVEGVVSFSEDTVEEYADLLEQESGFSLRFG